MLQSFYAVYMNTKHCMYVVCLCSIKVFCGVRVPVAVVPLTAASLNRHVVMYAAMYINYSVSSF